MRVPGLLGWGADGLNGARGAPAWLLVEQTAVTWTRRASCCLGSVTDPLEGLLSEHAIQRAVFAALGKEARRLGETDSLDGSYWDDAVLFLEAFVRDRHQRKEEDILFPALIQHGVRDRGGVIGIVRDERRDADLRVREFVGIVAQRRPVEIASAWRDCDELLSELLNREERFVFPSAYKLLDALDAARLRRGFWRVDCEADRALSKTDVVRITRRLGADTTIN